jgi:hypothetical protein
MKTRCQSLPVRHACRAALGVAATLRETRDELRILRILRDGFFNLPRPAARTWSPALIPSACPPAEPVFEEMHPYG